jgi:4-aminobutyrate aminotransferase
MIADEVQSGFARTGKLFAMDHYADKPDLMTMAKSLAGGMPLSGVVGRAEIMDAPAPGGLGGTYAGNPLAVAAAHAVLNIIDNESLCARLSPGRSTERHAGGDSGHLPCARGDKRKRIDDCGRVF